MNHHSQRGETYELGGHYIFKLMEGRNPKGALIKWLEVPAHLSSGILLIKASTHSGWAGGIMYHPSLFQFENCKMVPQCTIGP